MYFTRSGKIKISTSDHVCAVHITAIEQILNIPVKASIIWEGFTSRFLRFDIPTNVHLADVATELKNSDDIEIVEIRRFIKKNTSLGINTPECVKRWTFNHRTQLFIDKPRYEKTYYRAPYKKGKYFREIGKILKLSFTSVGYILKKHLETGSVENKPRPGGPSKLTSRAKRMIVRSATNKPMTSTKNIVNELLSSCNVSVSAQTVKNVLHSAGLKARTPRKKPYIIEVNRKGRLEFAMKYKNKPMDFWKKLLKPKNVPPTLKHDGGNVMMWGCVAHNGAGNLAFIDNKMNALAYIDVLRHNLLDSAKKLRMENTFIFQQNNDPKHTAIVTKTWLLYHVPRRLEAPPQSPGLNPIENLWMHLDTEVRKKCSK
ncbi:transposable element Tcb2 transposase [Trichonephila clavipes]|nr:transposable element Tcb2 transposase [Trichonephila clavipes]